MIVNLSTLQVSFEGVDLTPYVSSTQLDRQLFNVTDFASSTQSFMPGDLITLTITIDVLADALTGAWQYEIE